MNNWKDVIYLIEVNDSQKDKEGFPIVEEKKSERMAANIIGVTRLEEEHAHKLGYTADLEIEIMAINYSNEQLLEVENKKRYRIRRSYPKSSEILILTCSDISGGK